MRFEKSGVGGELDERPAGEPRLLGDQGALHLGLQHVRVQREAVALGQVVKCGEVVQADSLRRGDRHSGTDAIVCRAVPGADQVVVGVEQPFGVRRCGLVEGGGIDEFACERQLFGLGQLWLIEREKGPDPAVAVGRGHRVDDLRVGVGHQEGVVLHGGDAALQHLDRAEHGAQIGLARGRGQRRIGG